MKMVYLNIFGPKRLILLVIVNRVFVAKKKCETPYELWKGRVPNIGYFKVFGCKCFILNTKDKLGKFDTKADIGIFSQVL